MEESILMNVRNCSDKRSRIAVQDAKLFPKRSAARQEFFRRAWREMAGVQRLIGNPWPDAEEHGGEP